MNLAEDRNELTSIATILGHNWLLALMVVTVLWLMVTRLVETQDGLAKLLGPLGRRIVKSYQNRQERYRHDVAQEARLVAVELLPKVLPADYAVVKSQLHNVIDRVDDLEIENSALRAYVIYDEEWHFQANLAYVRAGAEPPIEMQPHMTWAEFLERWKGGWRPRAVTGTEL